MENETMKNVAAQMQKAADAQYHNEMAAFAQQVARYQEDAQRNWDINHVVIPPPVAPRRRLITWNEEAGGLKEGLAQAEVTAPVFSPNTTSPGGGIAAGNPTTNSTVADLTLKYVKAIAEAMGVKVA